MPADEFTIIDKYFKTASNRDDIALGVGDDAALLALPAGKQLVMTMDTLVSGVHFPRQTSAADIAYKSIAVNLSDLAAMGASPAWLMLSLSLPDADEDWLQRFSESFLQTCERYNIDLIGGDTTRGGLSVTVQASGFVDEGKVMRRDAASPGDRILVTGTLGDAALALHDMQSDVDTDRYCIDRLNRPTPRLGFAENVAEYCDCAIDISDGLIADLGHIVDASECGAELDLQAVPLSEPVAERISKSSDPKLVDRVCTGGDDYELCIVVSPDKHVQVKELAVSHDLQLTDIGVVTEGKGVVCYRDDEEIQFEHTGYKHYG